MKEPTLRTIALYQLTNLSRCIYNKACSTRTSTPSRLQNIPQACKAAFLAITEYHNQVAQDTMVQRLIDGTRFQDNPNITLAKTKFKDDKLGKWLGAVSYMATKIAEAFGVAKGKNNQGRGVNRRRISVVGGRGRGRGGIGQGRGWVSWGRGRGFGRSNGQFFNGLY